MFFGLFVCCCFVSLCFCFGLGGTVLHTSQLNTNIFIPIFLAHKNLLRIRVGLGVMTLKGYSTLPKVPGIEPQHQMQYLEYPFEGSNPFARDTVSIL